MYYTNINIKMKSDTDLNELVDKNIQLNYWLGSRVRGALIRELSKISCIKDELHCEECNAGIICPVKALFNRTENNTANPIVINNKIISNREFNLDITLIENAIIFREIIKDILIDGINIDIKNIKLLFKATDVRYKDDNEICRVDKYKISNKSYSKVKVNFKYPVRLQQSATSLEFYDLIRVIMTRFRSIQRITKEEYTFDYKELLEEAKNIKIESININRIDLHRYSSKHKKKMDAYCLVGDVTYSGDFSKFIDILNYGELFNIGKWTSMGLGKMEVTYD